MVVALLVLLASHTAEICIGTMKCVECVTMCVRRGSSKTCT